MGVSGEFWMIDVLFRRPAVMTTTMAAFTTSRRGFDVGALVAEWSVMSASKWQFDTRPLFRANWTHALSLLEQIGLSP
jgi:hypothetical protein